MWRLFFSELYLECRCVKKQEAVISSIFHKIHFSKEYDQITKCFVEALNEYYYEKRYTKERANLEARLAYLFTKEKWNEVLVEIQLCEAGLFRKQIELIAAANLCKCLRPFDGNVFRELEAFKALKLKDSDASHFIKLMKNPIYH